MTTASDIRRSVVARGESRLGYWRYGNDKPAKLDPDRAGFTDCSGFTRWAHLPYHTLRDMSFKQAVDGIEVASGTTVAQFLNIAHLIQPADVTAMALRDSWNSGADINHVELNTGAVLSLGHGSGIGPKRHNLTASWLLGDARRWTVRRFIPDDKTTVAKKPLTETEKEIATMKATHIIFQYGSALCFANVLAGTWAKCPNPKSFKEHITILKRAGAKCVEWKHLSPTKKNTVANPTAFGSQIEWKKAN